MRNGSGILLSESCEANLLFVLDFLTILTGTWAYGRTRVVLMLMFMSVSICPAYLPHSHIHTHTWR